MDQGQRLRRRPDRRLLSRLGRRQADGRQLRRRRLLRTVRLHRRRTPRDGVRRLDTPAAKGSWISEGDSSNFALHIDNGLRSWEQPGWGGWGGRQVVDPDDPNRWTNRGAQDADETGATPRDYAAARWFSAIQNDFAARMLWTVKGVDDTNHQPQACVAQGLDITRRPGQPVVLTPRARDVDGDAVTLTWWQYREAGTYPGTVELETTGAGTARFRVPADAQPGQTIHLILEATDDGSPALTHYQRVVVTVADQRDAVGRSGPGGCAQN